MAIERIPEIAYREAVSGVKTGLAIEAALLKPVFKRSWESLRPVAEFYIYSKVTPKIAESAERIIFGRK